MKYINKYLEYLKVVKKYSDKTIESYYDDLTLYNEFLGNSFINILDIDYDTVKEYMKYLYSLNISKNSISRKLSSIRGLYNYLVREDIVKDNYFNRINNPKKDKYLPKFLKDEEALDFDVTPHQLRHTYITNLLYAGVDPKTVQYLAGHENSKTTMDIYAKVKYNKPEELFGVVNGAFHQAIAE